MAIRRKHCLVCQAPYSLDPDDTVGVVYLDSAGNDVGPRPADDLERRVWRENNPRPHCASRHLLPAHDALVVALYGPAYAGKSALVATASRPGTSALALRYAGLTMRMDSTDQGRWLKDEAGRATATGTADKPYSPKILYTSMQDGHGKRTPGPELAVFDTGGEELTNSEFDKYNKFVPDLDAIIIAVPPPALGKALGEYGAQQSLELTMWGINRLVQYATDVQHRPEGLRTVVIALTKCDDYAPGDGFPRSLLRPHTRFNLKDQLAAEQPLIADFILANGGADIIDRVSELGSPVFFTATSGATNEATVAQRAPAAGSDPSRAADPFLITFMREGLGVYPESAK